MRRFTIIIGAWALAQAFMMVAAIWSDHDPLSPDTYARWDSGLYLAVASDGPTLERCVDIPNRSPDDWCGTAGWLPLYPVLIRSVAVISPMSPVMSAWVIAAIAQLAALTGLVVLLSRRQLAGTPLALITTIAALFPGAVWHHAIFPMSLAVALMWWGLVMSDRQHPLVAATLIGLTAVAHTSGIVIIAVWIVLSLLRHRTRTSLSVSAVAVTPSLALFAYQQLALGHWNAHLLIQSSYGHRIGFAPLVIVDRLIDAFAANARPYMLASIQDVYLVILITLAVVGLTASVLAQRTDETITTAALIGIVNGLVALSITGSDIAHWRLSALAVGIVPVLKNSSKPVLVGVAAANAALFIAIANGFVRGYYY
jgi:hypothetical protein